MKKKIVCTLMAAMMLLSLAACAGNTADEPAATAQSQTQTETTETTEAAAPAVKAYSFSANGVEIAINAPADDIIVKLGDPIDRSEENSCAFEGKDVTYFYNDYEILVAAPDGKSGYIYSVLFKSDAVKTAEGLELGMAEDKITELYPDAEKSDPFYIVKGDNMMLRIKADGGAVASIEYSVPAAQ